MKPYLKELTPKYISPDQICPNPRGFQALEGSIQGLKEEGGGFCGMWSLFVLELIFINPTKPTKEIIKEAFAITKEDPQYLKNVIRGYVLKTERLLNDYIKKIDANDGFSFNKADNLFSKKEQFQENLLELLLSFGGKNSRVKILEGEISARKRIANENKYLIALLETKSKQEINEMMKVVFRSSFTKLNTWSIKGLIDKIIKQASYNVKAYTKEIFDYFNAPLPYEPLP